MHVQLSQKALSGPLQPRDSNYSPNHSCESPNGMQAVTTRTVRSAGSTRIDLLGGTYHQAAPYQYPSQLGIEPSSLPNTPIGLQTPQLV